MLLDGATRIKDMVKRAVDLGMPAVALTDMSKAVQALLPR